MRFFRTFLFLLLYSLSGIINAQNYMAGGREHLPPKSLSAGTSPGTNQSLDGNWEINITPTAASVKDYQTSKDWHPILVPGEAMMQEFAIKNDTAFVYRKKLNIASTNKERLHIIRFNGVYNHAKVYCNGNFVREHFGGFTAWNADITSFLQPGQDNWLHVVVTDRSDDISYASGYAHHPIGGILRKVDYLILPKNRVEYLYANTGLANQYKDGTISVQAMIPAGDKVSATYNLTDASGKKIVTRSLKAQNNIFSDSIVIPSIKTWTAETPYLYTLTLDVLVNGKKQQTIVQKIGFRSIEINKSNEMLVNGNPVKLRGACRHDMHPLLGRSTNRQQDSLDVILAKESNMNFIRTSHYPPSDDFLEFCDRYGIYVQEETAICFVLDWREGIYQKSYKTMDDPAFTDRYLGQLSEMIDRDRNHASVIMWSIGNESWYGSNFQKEYDFVKSIEPTRPVSWSFPTTALDKDKKCFDILVSHYPRWDGRSSDLGKYEKNMQADYPIIGDEWAHVACYNTDLISYDPNVKDYWGKSLDSMWIYRFDQKGYLGGAIWGMIDETFHLKDKVTGYGPWGFIDVWRRKKPEFWNVKKAYSPVRLQINNASRKNDQITIPVYNRFDHTNLAAIKMVIISDGITTPFNLPSVAPHQHGTLELPATAKDSSIVIQFLNVDNSLIDEERISWQTAATPPNMENTGTWGIEEIDEKVILKNGNLLFEVNTRNGELLKSSFNGETILTGNPLPVINKPENANVLKNTAGIFSGSYKIQNFSFNKDSKNIFVIKSEGVVDKYPVAMTTAIYANGQVTISYTIDSIPYQTWDIGISVPVNPSFNKIKWKRKGYWSTYPKEHMSSNNGEAIKYSDNNENYRVAPKYVTAQSMHDYYINKTIDPAKARMTATEAYRGKKEHILSYKILGNKSTLEVISNGQQAAKMNVENNGNQQLLISGKWDYWSLSWGNYQGTTNKTKQVSGSVHIQIK